MVLYTSEGEERREYTTAWVTSGNKINVQLPDHHLGSPQPFWSFTVLLAAYNFDTPGSHISFYYPSFPPFFLIFIFFVGGASLSPPFCFFLLI